MNKILLTTSVALLFVCATLQAQVKDQYKDKSNEMTTIVVKEDTANDMDILNDQFDLDDVGMHQVIRITTREEATKPATTETLASNNNTNSQIVPTTAPAPLEAPILTASIENTSKGVSETPEINTVKTVTEETFEEVQEEVIAAPTMIATEEPSVKTTTERSTRSSSYAAAKRKSNKHQFKAFNKKFKKQKRKRVPRKRKRNKRCYRF